MSETVRRIAQSEWLTATNRLLVMAVSSIGFPLLIWLATTVMSLDREQAVIKAQNARQAMDIALMQQDRRTDAANDVALNKFLGQLSEKIDAQRSSLNRIEAYIDRQAGRN